MNDIKTRLKNFKKELSKKLTKVPNINRLTKYGIGIVKMFFPNFNKKNWTDFTLDPRISQISDYNGFISWSWDIVNHPTFLSQINLASSVILRAWVTNPSKFFGNNIEQIKINIDKIKKYVEVLHSYLGLSSSTTPISLSIEIDYMIQLTTLIKLKSEEIGNPNIVFNYYSFEIYAEERDRRLAEEEEEERKKREEEEIRRGAEAIRTQNTNRLLLGSDLTTEEERLRNFNEYNKDLKIISDYNEKYKTPADTKHSHRDDADAIVASGISLSDFATRSQPNDKPPWLDDYIKMTEAVDRSQKYESKMKIVTNTNLTAQKLEENIAELQKKEDAERELKPNIVPTGLVPKDKIQEINTTLGIPTDYKNENFSDEKKKYLETHGNDPMHFTLVDEATENIKEGDKCLICTVEITDDEIKKGKIVKPINCKTCAYHIDCIYEYDDEGNLTLALKGPLCPACKQLNFGKNKMYAFGNMADQRRIQTEVSKVITIHHQQKSF